MCEFRDIGTFKSYFFLTDVTSTKQYQSKDHNIQQGLKALTLKIQYLPKFNDQEI